MECPQIARNYLPTCTFPGCRPCHSPGTRRNISCELSIDYSVQCVTSSTIQEGVNSLDDAEQVKPCIYNSLQFYNILQLFLDPSRRRWIACRRSTSTTSCRNI